MFQFIKRASFTRRVDNMIESSADEKEFKSAFNVIKDNVSSFYYPSANVILLLFKQIMVSHGCKLMEKNHCNRDTYEQGML